METILSKKGISFVKHVFKRVVENLFDIIWWKESFVKLLFFIYFKKIKGNKGVCVVDEVWDNLIIMDACRHDALEEVLGQKINYKISRGSCTPEFLIENFKGKKYDDIVYVTANPFVDALVKDSFHKIIPVWKLAWDKKHGTVMPKDVVKYALIAKKMYPKKRLIIHFMQPHYPFVRHPEIKATISSLVEYAEGKVKRLRDISPWKLAKRKKVNISDVWVAYKDNLKFVLPFVFKLAKQLGGKTVITSDHGNIFERVFVPIPILVAGHPCSVYVDGLVKVPWLLFK